MIKAQPHIVCASCRLGDTIIAGARHFDMVMHSQLEKIFPDDDDKRKFAAECEQGFIDQFGEFHTREASMIIAKENGQFKRRGEAPAHLLFSEDLY